MGSMHLILVMVGGGILAIPRAMAWLGWVVGIPAFFAIAAVSM